MKVIPPTSLSPNWSRPPQKGAVTMAVRIGTYRAVDKGERIGTCRAKAAVRIGTCRAVDKGERIGTCRVKAAVRIGTCRAVDKGERIGTCRAKAAVRIGTCRGVDKGERIGTRCAATRTGVVGKGGAGSKKRVALIIKPHWGEAILSRTKDWEIRSSNTRIRRRVGITMSGSSVVSGSAVIVDSFPLTREVFEANAERHRCERWEDVAGRYRRPHVWVVARARRLNHPIPIARRAGQVVWARF